MMTNSLDEAYGEAARRREPSAVRPAASPTPGDAPWPRRVVALALLVGLGTVTGVAAAQVRAREAAQDQGRSGLVSDVRDRTAATDALAREAARRQDAVTRRRAEALQAGAAGRVAAARLTLAELLAGTVAVTGAGIEVVLDDAERRPTGGLDARGGRPGDGRVLDRDLQELVNGLWAAGAEAVSVNDQRLTALTAIRSAGESVLVDKRPLSPPYAVRAIGGPDLETRFVDGEAGRRLATYTSLYGLRLDVRAREDLALPAAREPELRRAVPAGGAP